MISQGHDSDTMLGTTAHHTDMILSTLSISYHVFGFGFPKRPRAIGNNIPYLYTHFPRQAYPSFFFL